MPTVKKVKKVAPVVKAKGKTKGSTPGVCCMTGSPTSAANKHFRPGMDARLKSALVKVYRGEASLNSIPKPALALLRQKSAEGEPFVGFRIAGDKLQHVGAFAIGNGAKSSKKKAAQKEVQRETEKASRNPARKSKKDAAARRLARAEREAPVVEEEEEEAEEEEE